PPVLPSLLHGYHLDNHYLPAFPTRRSSDLWQLRGSQGYGAVHFSPNGKWLAAGGGTLLDVDTGRVFQQLSPRSYVLGFSPDSSLDRKSTRLNSSHEWISYAVFCLKKKKSKS